MSQYKTLIIYTISNDQSKKSFEEELEKYGLERVGTQDIFAYKFSKSSKDKKRIDFMFLLFLEF